MMLPIYYLHRFIISMPFLFFIITMTDLFQSTISINIAILEPKNTENKTTHIDTQSQINTNLNLTGTQILTPVLFSTRLGHTQRTLEYSRLHFEIVLLLISPD